MARHALQHTAWDQRQTGASNDAGQHPVVGLHFMDASRRGAIGMKPAFKMAAVGAVGAKRIDAGAIHFTGARNGRVAEGRDDHHLFGKYR